MMFGSFQTFKPCEGYNEKGGENRYFQDSNGLMFPSDIFASIIYFEYIHREGVQLEKCLQQEHQALQKAARLGEDVKDLHDFDRSVKDFGKMLDFTGRTLYRFAARLPRRPLLKIYDEIRQDPT